MLNELGQDVGVERPEGVEILAALQADERPRVLVFSSSSSADEDTPPAKRANTEEDPILKVVARFILGDTWLKAGDNERLAPFFSEQDINTVHHQSYCEQLHHFVEPDSTVLYSLSHKDLRAFFDKALATNNKHLNFILFHQAIPCLLRLDSLDMIDYKKISSCLASIDIDDLDDKELEKLELYLSGIGEIAVEKIASSYIEKEVRDDPQRNPYIQTVFEILKFIEKNDDVCGFEDCLASIAQEVVAQFVRIYAKKDVVDDMQTNPYIGILSKVSALREESLAWKWYPYEDVGCNAVFPKEDVSPDEEKEWFCTLRIEKRIDGYSVFIFASFIQQEQENPSLGILLTMTPHSVQFKSQDIVFLEEPLAPRARVPNP